MKQIIKLLIVFLMPVICSAQMYNDPDINYVGSWKLSQDCNCAYSNVEGDEINYSFSTSSPAKVYVIGERLVTHGKAKIEINEQVFTADQYSATKKENDTLVTASVGKGNHDVKITVTGEKNSGSTNSYVVFKRFSIVENQGNVGEAVQQGDVDSSPSQLSAFISGKKYFSVVHNDSVFTFDKDSSLVQKVSFDEKLMLDLRVISSNQNKLEIWLIVIGGLFLASIAIQIFKK